MRSSGFKTVLILLFTTFLWQGFSQDILLLEKPGKKRYFKYLAGEKIMIRTSSGIIQDIILKIDSGHIVLYQTGTVPFDSIDAVLRNRYWMNKLREACILAGGGYLLIGTVNNAITGDGPVLDRDILIPSAVLLSSGLLFETRRLRVFPIRHSGWRVKGLVR